MSLALDRVITRRLQVLEAITAAAEHDPRVRSGLLVGSLASENDDAYSDIDLVLITEADALDSLLDDRLTFPADFGDVLLQLDSSWNVWSGASQVLTLFDGDLPLWVDMDIWPPSVPGTPNDARVVSGVAPPPIDMTLADLATHLKERHGPGRVRTENVDGVGDVAKLAWHLKSLARGKGGSLEVVRRALEMPWRPELEGARGPLGRYAEHIGEVLGI